MNLWKIKCALFGHKREFIQSAPAIMSDPHLRPWYCVHCGASNEGCKLPSSTRPAPPMPSIKPPRRVLGWGICIPEMECMPPAPTPPPARRDPRLVDEQKRPKSK